MQRDSGIPLKRKLTRTRKTPACRNWDTFHIHGSSCLALSYEISLFSFYTCRYNYSPFFSNQENRNRTITTNTGITSQGETPSAWGSVTLPNEPQVPTVVLSAGYASA